MKPDILQRHPDYVFTADDRERLRQTHKAVQKILSLIQGDEHNPGFSQHLLRHIHEMEHRIMATVQETLDSVTAVAGKADSLITLTNAIKAKLDAMPPGGLTPEQQSILDQAKALADTTSGKVQSAIDANDDDPNTPPVAGVSSKRK